MDEEHLVAGAVVDGFRLEERLHAGGMATLWRVSRADAAMPLLMKIPLLRFGEDPGAIVGFEVEGMILPRLGGPHVPRFVAAGDFDRPYIVMELIAGRSLRTWLDETPLPVAETAALGAATATALDDLHRQGVIHLDLKPSNVIVRPGGGAVVLVDFGLSRHADLPDLVAQEFRGPAGTGAYIAPEQLHGDRADPRSDLFALGVILYFLVTGTRPFGDPQTVGGWRRRLWRDPVPPRRRRPDCPPWLQEIILRCLDVEPAARHPTAGQLAWDLAHPHGMALTARAERMAPDPLVRVARRWWRSTDPDRPVPPSRRPHPPLVMAAIDLAESMQPLADALWRAVARILRTEPDARLACVNVLKISRLSIDELEDERGQSLHLAHLAQLKRWARPFRLAPERITYHVLESSDPAGALLEYARGNRVDHIVMGARASSTLRRYLGSVSSKVVAEAGCTVTVVRTGGEPGEAPGRPAGG